MAEEFPAPFLGTGWEFPPAFVPVEEKSTVAMVSGRIDIEQSLGILLSTLPGERIMQPRYGCDLTPILFEPLTTSLITDICDRNDGTTAFERRSSISSRASLRKTSAWRRMTH